MNTQPYTIYDLECTALPEEQLLELMPELNAPSNYTNPDKIREAIAAKKKAWMEDAALSALTGTILCIGLKFETGERKMLMGDEAQILREFFTIISDQKEVTGGATIYLGYNNFEFDNVYICRRAWLLGVPVPRWIRNGRYWHSAFQDIRATWQLGDRTASTGGMNGLAKALGVQQKTGSGRDFGKLWQSDRNAAIAYCLTDLDITEAIGIKMGIITPRNTEQDELPL